MQTMPHEMAAQPGTNIPERDRRGVAPVESLTPAERIALTIALLNSGLDVVDGVARACLVRCARGTFRGSHEPARNRPPTSAT